MRKYILRDIHGNRIEEQAPSMRLAVKQLADRGIKLYGVEPTHWTDRHIVQAGNEFVGYDEAGLEYFRHNDRQRVVDVLVAYEKTLHPDPTHCSGDCGDCNDARECATKEQAL